MQQSFLYQSSQIFYTDNGEGNVIFLIHGFGEDASIWNLQLDFLKLKYRVIIPNLPGTNSSQLIEKNDVTIDDYANCIYHLFLSIENIKAQQISMFGHSMGGYITLAFAKLFPNKLNAFGLIHSTAFADSEEKKQVRLRGIEMMQEYGAYAFLKTTIPNLFSTHFKQKNPEIVDELIENGKHFSVAGLQQYYKAIMNRKDTTETLVKSAVPVLFIMGTEDIAAPINDILQQCYLPNKAQIKVLENVGHLGMLEATKTVNETINSFLNNVQLV